MRLFASARRVFAVFATTLLFAGCEGLFPETPDVPPGTDITIKATTEKTVSRTTLGVNDEVLWQQGDDISIRDVAGSAEGWVVFNITDGVGSTSATFQGKQPDFAGPYYLYYGDITGLGSFSTRIQATQKYDKNGGFSQYVNPMAAVCEKLGDDVEFKNVAGIIELQISGTQALSSIEISAKEPLSGLFNLVQDTRYERDDRYAVEEGGSVTLTEIGGVQLEEGVAKTFKFVVIPGTYTEFTVKMTNADGTVVTKTAEGEIVVERSKITPIAGLVDSAEPAQKPKYVNLQLVEGDTSWHHARVKTEMTAYVVNQILYMWGTDEFIDEWMAANPDKSILDMMLVEGGLYSEDVDFTYETVPGINYNFYALGLFINESQETYMVGDIEHISYTSEIPYDQSASLSIEIPEETLTESSAVAHITPSTPFSKVYVSFYSAAVDSDNSVELIYYNVFMHGGIHENVTSALEVPVGGLAPEKEYVVYAIGETPEGKYTPLAKEFFTTPAHTEATVTATATIAEIKEWSATFNVTMSQGAVGYKVGCWTKETVDLPGNAEVDWAYQVSSLQGLATGSTFTLPNLTEETSYVAFFIAYDANDHYGPASRVEFTTNAITPVQNVAGFEAMLGDWTLSYLDAQGSRHEDDITITISENIPGKLFNIKGLLGAGGSVYGGSGDDTVVARYFEDGTIQIDWEKGIADPSNYGQAYEIYCSLLVGNSIYYQGPQIWANEQGTYKIGHQTAPADSGYAFGAWRKSDGEFEGVLGGAHYDVVMKKVVSNNSNASTEKFSRQETVSPNWKAVAPVRIERSNITPVKKSGFDLQSLNK